MISLVGWSRVSVVLCVCLLGGCGGGVQFIPEGESGGVVLYVYKGSEGHLFSPRRAEAFEKIKEACGGPFKVLKEGEGPPRRRSHEGVTGSEEFVEHRWGIRFQCTEGPLVNRQG